MDIDTFYKVTGWRLPACINLMGKTVDGIKADDVYNITCKGGKT